MAAALLASVAPYDARGLDWMDGMDQSNVEEFNATLAGVDALEALLQPEIEGLRDISGPSSRRGHGRPALERRQGRASRAPSPRSSRSASAAPWRTASPAGATTTSRSPATGASSLSGIAVAGRGLAGRARTAWFRTSTASGWQPRFPTAEAHLFEDEGHVSLIAQIDKILADLATLGD